jgi:large subunit ribosomal protein L4
MKLPLYDKSGQAAGEVTVAKEIFERKMNEQVVHSALVWYQASQRRGTHSTLTCGEVSGGGKKPWKQKGTGRARAGSNRSPLWRHGGVTFGPKPRDYSFALPKKVKKLALKVVLSDKAREGKVKIVEAFQVTEAKTKAAAKFFSGLALGDKVLVITAQPDEAFLKAARNLANISLIDYHDLTVYDLMKANELVIEKKAADSLKEFLSK